MRLIDADKLFVNMDKGMQGPARDYLKFYQMAVRDEPTAYDVDKVVEKMKELPAKTLETYTDAVPVYNADTGAVEGFTKSYEVEKEFIDRDKAIWLVKSGGVE